MKKNTIQKAAKPKKDSKATLKAKIKWYSDCNNWRVIGKTDYEYGTFSTLSVVAQIQRKDYSTKEWCNGCIIYSEDNSLELTIKSQENIVNALERELNGPKVIGTLCELKEADKDEDGKYKTTIPPSRDGKHDGEMHKGYVWNQSFWSDKGEWIKL